MKQHIVAIKLIGQIKNLNFFQTNINSMQISTIDRLRGVLTTYRVNS